MITAHHKVLDEQQESRLHHTCAVDVQDLVTQWNQSYPCKTKSAQETQRREISENSSVQKKTKILIFTQVSGL